MRSINTRGRQIKERIEHTENLVGRADQIADWFSEGEEIVTLLASAVHGDLDPRVLNESAVRRWQAFGRDIEREVNRNMAAMGRRVRGSGMSVDEAAQAILRGEFDPLGRD
jgi:hypothetical protein